MVTRRDIRLSGRRRGLRASAGVLLVVIGALALARNLGDWAPLSERGWGLLLLGLGLACLMRAAWTLSGASANRRAAGTDVAMAACFLAIGIIQWTAAPWSRWWPVVLITGGLVLIARRWASGRV